MRMREDGHVWMREYSMCGGERMVMCGGDRMVMCG